MTFTTVLDAIPKTITAGESVSWRVSLADYPASSSWVLTYTLVKSDNQIQIAAAASGADHLVEIPYTTTQAYDPGEYDYQAHVSNGTERYRVGSGKIEILADFAVQVDGYDNRDWLDTSIEALQASIQSRASKTQLSQTVGGVQIQHMSLTDQINALRELKNIRAGKKIAKRGLKSIRVSF